MNSKLILDAKDRPSTGKWILLSFQHVFAMFSATVLVPLLTGLPISVALFSSGVGTLIYIICTKASVPIYLGSSFAYIAYIQTAIQQSGGGLGAALTGLFVVGIVYILVAVIIKLSGTAWLNKLLPPIIVGPMIIVIGLGLASSAVTNSDIIAGGDWRNVVVALATMAIIAVTSIKAKGFFKVIPFMIGIIGGYVLAILIGLIPNGEFGTLVDFKPVLDVLSTPSKWFKIPEFSFLGFEDKVFSNGVQIVKFNFATVVSAIPLAFVTICEHIGDHKVLGRITGRDYITEPGLHRTLLGDGIATAFAGLIGGPANTSYGENTSVVGMTKIGSVWVTGGAAVIAILLSFINIVSTLIASIPNAVMGGVCLILYGFIASNGLKTMIDEKLDLSKTRNLIIVSVMLVIGLGGATLSFGSFSFSGMSLSAVLGILLNVLLPHEDIEEGIQE